MSVRENRELPVLLLCGGKGERLRPLTDSIPKPMVKIKEKSIIDYQLEFFIVSGFNDFIVATGYKSDVIESHLKSNYSDINIVNSGDVDIIQRIKDANKVIKGNFILCYGDTLADVDINSLLKFHESHDGLVSITSYPLQSPFGIIDMDYSGKVISFIEKPVLDHWINIGYMVFSKEIWGTIDRYSDFVDFLNALLAENLLYSFKHRGVHITVNTIKELYDAENNISSFAYNNSKEME